MKSSLAVFDLAKGPQSAAKAAREARKEASRQQICGQAIVLW